MLLIRPAAAQRVTVFGSTRNKLATSPGVSRRSRDSTMTIPSVAKAPRRLRSLVLPARQMSAPAHSVAFARRSCQVN
jgi:hypothetical protein